MNQDKEIPLYLRYYAVQLYLLRDSTGKRIFSIQEILQKAQISKATLYRLFEKWERKRSLSDSPRPGRPSKITPTGDRRLTILAKQAPLKAYKTIAEDYNEGQTLERQVSLWTIKRHLTHFGILSFRPSRKTTLEPRHIKERYVWAREYQSMNMGYWESIIFCDETRVLLNQIHPKTSVKRPKNSRFEPKFIHYSEKYGGGGVSFWGCITYWGPGPLYRLYGSMESKDYVNILGRLKLDLQEVGIDHILIQDDNLSAHRTKEVEDIKDKLNILSLPSWPSNSPDLSPIENIWSIWKERVYAKKPKTLESLEEIALEVWNNLEPGLFRNLYESMPNRLNLIIHAKGRRIKY